MSDRPSFHPDIPVAGFYSTRLVKGGIKCPVRIYFGCPIVDGEQLDRSPRWCVLINGASARTERNDEGDAIGRVPHPVDSVWPYCALNPISKSEYRFQLRRVYWAKQHAPWHPAARPREPIDLHSLKPGF